MQLTFCLFKYFPYGGLQRDFMQFYQQARLRGHKIRVYCIQWDGPKPDGLDVHFVPAKGFTNHRRNTVYANYVREHIKNNPVDLVVGFNKMLGLDVYFAADTCYEAKAQKERGWWYRQMPRYKHFSRTEAEIFTRGKKTEILLISETEKQKFIDHYGTESTRINMLPPGIPDERKAPDNAAEIRRQFRQEFKLQDDDHLLLFIGSGFITKGLNRAITALASLPDGLRAKTRLFIIGQDKIQRFAALAGKLSVSAQVSFLGDRDDVLRFLLSADCLIHPALGEAAGIVLLEAVVAGLPVLVTDVCGYAHHIEKANAGIVVGSPFEQVQLNNAVKIMLDEERRKMWRENALAYARNEDLYSMHKTGMDIIEAVFNKKVTLRLGAEV